MYHIDTIQVRRHKMMKFRSEHPIYKFCREAEWNRGSGSHLYWWNQPMELEETSAEAETDTSERCIAFAHLSRLW